MTDAAKKALKSGVIGARPEGAAKGDASASYYDVPMLKASEWTWMIPVYFATGGLAGGAFVIGRLADRLGGARLRPLAHAATLVSAAGVMSAPPLLILDLGDPKRFHHMLRVFKPISPMSMGTWTLTLFSGCVGLAALREFTGGRGPVMSALLAGVDAAGIPLGLVMAGYTGVLISTTSTPIWTQNPWLGPLFTTSAFEIATAAIGLALETGGRGATASARALKPVKMAARLGTATTLAGYLSSAGELADPLIRGKYAPHIWGGAVVAGLAFPLLLDKVAERRGLSRGKARALRTAASVMGMLGGFALKWAVGSAGHVSGKDPEAARLASKRRVG